LSNSEQVWKRIIAIRSRGWGCSKRSNRSTAALGSSRQTEPNSFNSSTVE
jgi:hypothetical protein